MHDAEIPTASERLLSRGEAAFQAGDFETARACFREVAREHPRHPRLVNDLGVLACQDGDLETAESCFEAAHAARPRERQYLANLAEILLARDKSGRARRLLSGFFAAVGEDEGLRGLWREAEAGSLPPEAPGPSPMPAAAPPAPMPRAVWQNRADMDRAPGGDTTLVREMVRNLGAAGASVRLELCADPSLAGFDLVHLTNISRTVDTQAQLRNARLQGKPSVLIPLYEDMERYLEPALKADVLFRYLAMHGKILPLDVLRKIRESFDLQENPLDQPVARQYGIGDYASQKAILEGVDLILTSGAEESRTIRRKFGGGLPLEELHYGFNPAFAKADPAGFVSRHGLRDFVLCVGRLEPRKNQWQLMEVFRHLPHLQLVFIGRFSDPSMEPLIKAYAPPNVRFIERLPFEELVSAFGAARLHVLPSWYELPGLVSLEAAAAGCRVVASDWGTARDYLGDRVAYCSPEDPVGLKAVVQEAYETRPDPGLRDYVLETFTWKRAAEKCLEAYRRVLARR